MKRNLLPIMALAGAIAACQQTTPLSGAFAQTPPAATTASPPSTPNPAEFDKQMARVEESMTKMQQQMDRLRQTQDPQERQRLLRQHWDTMQSAMAAMQGMPGAGGPMMGGHMMGGPMMGGPMMGWRGAGGYYSNLTPEQLRQRQYMTDRHMAMQQQMMNHMMWHQHWMSEVPPAKK